MLVMTLPAEMIGEDMYQMLNMANQGTEDLFGLLDNLLKWTKSQIGKLNVVYQNFDVTETVSGVIDIFGLVSSMKNIKIIFDQHEPIMVHADADMMKTIVRNFLSNALKFSYENSEIHVLAYKEDGMAVIGVRDHGQGMSPEDQEKLLKTETHFSKYGTNNEEGSGLGLLLCLDFAQKNGGKMWFESEQGKGSTFYFSVPLIKE
jgi:two-component system sensor histidine kinase/response regulator